MALLKISSNQIGDIPRWTL